VPPVDEIAHLFFAQLDGMKVLHVRTPCFDPVLPHGRVSLQAAAHDGDGAEVG
jgi:hypothetical protein